MKLDEANLAAMLRLRGHAGDSGAPSPDAASPLAWRREMERAQADAWFHQALRTPQHHGSRTEPQADESTPHHTLVSGERFASHHRSATAAAAKAGPAAGTFPKSVALLPDQAANAPAALALAPAAASVFTAATEHAPIAPTVEPTASTVDRTLSAVPGRQIEYPVTSDSGNAAAAEAPAPEAQSRGAAGMTRPSDTARLPVRVHIEGDAQHATVWLGVDTAARAELPSVTEAIARWLAQAGYGVPTFVCNGRVIEAPGRESFAADDRAAGPVPAIEAFVIEPPTGDSA